MASILIKTNTTMRCSRQGSQVLALNHLSTPPLSKTISMPLKSLWTRPWCSRDRLLESDYRPENDNNRYNGPTRLREALFKSINLVSIRVLLEVGAGKVLKHVDKFGFNSEKFPRNTQLAIGGGTMGVAPIDMAQAYAVIANGGFLVQARIINQVTDQDGDVVFLPERTEIFSKIVGE